MNLTRRDALARTFAAGISAQVAAALQHAERAVQQGASFETLTPAEANDIEALSCQIIPSDDGPGAREAGVIYFIDRALSTFEHSKLEVYRRGLDAARQLCRKLSPQSKSIAGLSSAEQTNLLRSIENTPFFDALRTHTVLGFLGSPVYGGNRGGAGWAYIGFEDRAMFQPPFGYYDAEAQKDKG